MKKPKTFEDLGLKFESNEGGSFCSTCRDNSCHNQVVSKIDNDEYSVHISYNDTRTSFAIQAELSSATTSHSDMFLEFDNEEKAVKHLCVLFNGFNCF